PLPARPPPTVVAQGRVWKPGLPPYPPPKPPRERPPALRALSAGTHRRDAAQQQHYESGKLPGPLLLQGPLPQAPRHPINSLRIQKAWQIAAPPSVAPFEAVPALRLTGV